MTHQQVFWAINSVAAEAAASSFDAHGYYVPAETAWDFMMNMLADIEDDRVNLLPRAMPRQFQHDYLRHCRNHRGVA
jgi:hypothetical protein